MLVSLLALALASTAAGSAHPVIPSSASVRAHRAAPAPTEVLVSAAWLKQHLGDPDLVILEVGMPHVRGAANTYPTGHIPGARLLDVHAISTDEGPDSLTMQLVSPDSLQRVFASLGVSDNSHVVLYSNWASVVSRAFFTLDYLGRGDRTSVLDGGMDAWKKAGGALDTVTPPVRPGTLHVTAHPSVVVDGAWVRQHLTDPSIAILDARDHPFYTGAQLGHSSQRAGHVPGAYNVYFTRLLDSTGVFRSPDEVRAILAQAGVPTHRTLVVYCHIGQTGSVAYLQARRAGIPVKLYDGSFEGWSRDKSNPVTSGEAP